MKKPFFPLFILAAFTCGCTVGPNYQRPKTDVPATYRPAPHEENASPQAPPTGANTPEPQTTGQSLGDQKWWEVFQDPQLQELIRTALEQNYDVQIAATRVLQAQAQLGITRRFGWLPKES